MSGNLPPGVTDRMIDEAYQGSEPQEPPTEAERWRPIETAPRDGTWIIGCCIEKPTPQRLRYITLRPEYQIEPMIVSFEEDTGHFLLWGDGNERDDIILSHWIPLPPSGLEVEP